MTSCSSAKKQKDLREASGRADEEEKRELTQAAARVHSCQERGEPWKAIPALQGSAGDSFDMSLADWLSALIDECPTFPPVEGAPSQHEAPRFLATIADLAAVRKLLTKWKAPPAKPPSNRAKGSDRSRRA